MGGSSDQEDEKENWEVSTPEEQVVISRFLTELEILVAGGGGEYSGKPGDISHSNVVARCMLAGAGQGEKSRSRMILTSC